MLLEPIEKEIGGKKFILSKFPAVAGREIMAAYAASGFPNITDYKSNEVAMFKLMAYVAVPIDGSQPIPLTTRALIDNHAGDWNTLVKIEHEMIELNSTPLEHG